MREARCENFIEIWHEDRESTTNWVATKSRTKWKDGSAEMMNSWQLENSSIYIYDIEDIKALRKLIDAVEERILEERN